jgi:hypothetical protein
MNLYAALLALLSTALVARTAYELVWPTAAVVLRLARARKSRPRT